MCNCCQKPQTIAPPPTQCCHCCQNHKQEKQKVKGKFGVAYVIETGDKKSKPCGWEVEFNDTPSQIENNCKKMMKWISCPPLGECDNGNNGNSLQCCQCRKPQQEHVCSCQRPQRHYEAPNCCCNSNRPSKGQKMYFSSKKPCCHCNNQSESSIEAQQCCQCASNKKPTMHCDCSCSKCKCTKKSTKKAKEEHKPSKNWLSPDSHSKKDRELRSLYTMTNKEPKKGPDKMTDNFEVNDKGEEREIKSVDYNEEPSKSTNNESKEEKIPDIFNIEVDTPPTILPPLKPPRKKIKGKQLLKMIKTEHKKEMDAIHPHPPNA